MTTWTCPGRVVHVHDGDTILCDIDLGYHVTIRSAVRVEGLAAPELATVAGKASRAYAETLLPPGAAVEITSKKLLGSFEKYGRVLAEVNFTAPDAPAILSSFGLVMIAAGQGKAWDGTGKQPT